MQMMVPCGHCAQITYLPKAPNNVPQMKKETIPCWNCGTRLKLQDGMWGSRVTHEKWQMFAERIKAAAPKEGTYIIETRYQTGNKLKGLRGRKLVIEHGKFKHKHEEMNLYEKGFGKFVELLGRLKLIDIDLDDLKN